MSIPETTPYELLRKECWQQSFQSFGYGNLFDKRSVCFGRNINLLKVFGILTPALVGVTAIGYGYTNFLKNFIWLAGIITIVQFGFSILAIIYKWDDELSYAFEASQAYSSLWDRFKKLAKFPPENIDDLNKEFDLLNTEFRLRNQQDSKHNIKEWELRRGMRGALREFQWDCVGCNKKALSMDSTDCDICGKYSFKYKTFNL